MLALGWIIKPVTLCMKCIILTASKCSTKEADVVVKDNATKNVILGCVEIEMVGVKGIDAAGKSDQRRSAGDQNGTTMNPVHAGKDICVYDEFIPKSVTIRVWAIFLAVLMSFQHQSQNQISYYIHITIRIGHCPS